MSFRLSQSARKYFTHIDDHSKTGKFRSLWDKYYLCLMAGLSRANLGEEPPADAEFYNTFHADYFDQRFEILGALAAAEIRRQGISGASTSRIQEIMLELLDHSRVTFLSDHGASMMNKYAEGGYQIIKDEIDDPYELDVFLRKYYELFGG